MIRLYWSHCFGVAAAMEDSVGGGVVVVRRWNPTPKPYRLRRWRLVFEI